MTIEEGKCKGFWHNTGSWSNDPRIFIFHPLESMLMQVIWKRLAPCNFHLCKKPQRTNPSKKILSLGSFISVLGDKSLCFSFDISHMRSNRCQMNIPPSPHLLKIMRTNTLLNDLLNDLLLKDSNLPASNTKHWKFLIDILAKEKCDWVSSQRILF